MTVSRTPQRKTPCRECENASRNCAWTSGGRARLGRGQVDAAPRGLVRDAGVSFVELRPRAGGEDGAEDGDTEGPPIERKKVADDVATPMSRGRARSGREHEHLHHEADAEAEDSHVDGGEPGRGIAASVESRNIPTTSDGRPGDREDLVAARCG